MARGLFQDIHQLLAQAPAPGAMQDLELLHLGPVASVGLHAQRQLHAGQDLFLVDHHPQQQAAVLDTGLHVGDIGLGLAVVEVGHEADGRAMADRVEQQFDQALAVVGKAFSMDPSQLAGVHRSITPCEGRVVVPRG